ncbi:MAG: efflux RND transporter periplasmic adaptor subunit [Armatimonadota bacterium]|nr:efflux RND transporter periplasmic adaptor subunit [Armatimonadota bacterium]
MGRGKSRITTYALIIIVILFGIIVSRQIGRKSHKPVVKSDIEISVKTAFARTGTMDSVIEVSGDIKALKGVSLSAKAPLRVVSVPYREGDHVSAGTVVIQQDTSDLRAQVQQAEAALQAAKARLSQAITSKTVSDTQTEAQIASAKAALEAARARLQMLKKGARSQEIAQAENAVASAKANYENAKSNLDRMRNLFTQGAISPLQMDQAQTQYDVALAQYESAKQQLSLVKAGAREEEIEAAQKQVEQAEEALRIAQANRGQKELRLEEIKSARAGVAQAEANLAYARQQLENASIRTPISGTISKRMTEPGQMATPGVPLIEIVALNTVYFDASVSEIDIEKIKVGQPVQVKVDAIPNRTFMGSVLKILPTADSSTRQLRVWISVPNLRGEIKPGMFARGEIRVGRHNNTIIIPKDALMIDGGGYTVYQIVDSVAHLRKVQVGFMTRDEAEILSGIRSGDQIVVSGQDKLSDGVKVHVVN